MLTFGSLYFATAIDCAWFTSTAVAVAAMMVLALTCEQDDRGVRASGAGL